MRAVGLEQGQGEYLPDILAETRVSGEWVVELQLMAWLPEEGVAGS